MFQANIVHDRQNLPIRPILRILVVSPIVRERKVAYHKYIRCLGQIASNFKELQEIIKLTMDISTQRNRSAYGNNSGFFR